MAVNIISLILLLSCTVFDLKKNEVPLPLTVLYLVGASVFSLVQEAWSLVILVTALVLISDLSLRQIRIGFSLTATIFTCALQPNCMVDSLSLLGCWLLWEFGAMGGADVKLLFGNVLVIGEPAVFIPIAILGGIQGVVASIRKQRTIPFVVSIFGGTLFYVIYPAIQ